MAGLKVKALMSIGHPGESYKTIEESKNWILKVKPDETDCTIITLYPGSAYFDYSIPYENIWKYTAKSGDNLYSDNNDFINQQYFYKSKNDLYESHVYTDYLSKQNLVECRNQLEIQIKKEIYNG
jgi:radical SAM superfamily enzyme YgiQ (UPF0313 family)